MANAREVRVAVIGGGIGGLAAANALARRGLNVTVYERTRALGEVGAGVMITPNGSRALAAAGVGPALADVGAPVAGDSYYRRSDGTLVAPVVTADQSGRNGLWGVHRADLLSALATALPDGMVRTGYRCVNFRQDRNAAHVEFDNGEEIVADVVVAADGISSILQKFVLGPVDAPIFSGIIAYRGLLSARDLTVPNDAVSVWMGKGKHFMCYPVRRGELLNYVGFVPSGEHAAESWSAPGDPADLKRHFAGWDERVAEILSRVTDTFWWGVYDREPFPRWSSGRLALLGDAAHPMRPHMGQGANQAIEDGVALSVILAGTACEEVPAALRSYERLRRDRTTQCQAGSREQGNRTESASADLDRRDADLAASAAFRRAIYSYDVEDAARQFVASLESAKVAHEG
jgi:salicylate hydroxylase